MTDWRAQLLSKFMPQVSRLVLVADPDGLLLEEQLLQGIRDKGFDILSFDDPIAFRYLYESKYRSQCEDREECHQALVVRCESRELSALPYDLLQIGQKLSFDLGKLFPNLSYPVIASLDKSHLDTLYKAQQEYAPGVLGDNATKDFALRHVFGTVTELIHQPSDLLRVLLSRHYKNVKVPEVLDDYFIHSLWNQGLFLDWPLEEIVSNRQSFFRFLQERWPVFLNRLAMEQGFMAHNGQTSTKLEFNGPTSLPFDHDDVRVYIDSLFLDGLLQPVAHHESQFLSGTWVTVGIKTDPELDLLRRLDGLARLVAESLPSSRSRHQDWLAFAYRWAELSRLKLELQNILKPEDQDRFSDLSRQLDSEFLTWIENRYIGLHNQPPLPPVMLHHVPRALARQKGNTGNGKIALVVIDGLALNQWLAIRDVLQDQQPMLRFQEDAVFAWLPTITSVSRQALFSGKPPFYFPDSITKTDKDASLWTQFWMDQKLREREIAYLRGLGDGDLEEVCDAASNPSIQVMGLVINKVDKIMHGMELGASGMLSQVRDWAKQGYLSRLLNILLDSGFDITLTSDHGNIEAYGCGSPKEGAVAEVRGERVRIFSDELLRKKVKASFPDSIEWPSVGLPDDFLPLIAPDRTAFVGEGARIVTHGGISLEEVIVPLIHIQRRTP